MQILSWIGLQPVFWAVVKVLILNSMLFFGEIYLKIVGMYNEFRYEYAKTNNVKGYKNFVHYLWAKFVFFVFGLWEEELDWFEFKKIAVAPFLEEFMFRGLIFGMYRDSGIYAGHS